MVEQSNTDNYKRYIGLMLSVRAQCNVVSSAKVQCTVTQQATLMRNTSIWVPTWMISPSYHHITRGPTTCPALISINAPVHDTDKGYAARKPHKHRTKVNPALTDE